jgi:hypothetical protein
VAGEREPGRSYKARSWRDGVSPVHEFPGKIAQDESTEAFSSRFSLDVTLEESPFRVGARVVIALAAWVSYTGLRSF